MMNGSATSIERSPSSSSPHSILVTIVRHGETSYNASKTVQGHLDVDLNEQGRAQARVVGRYLASQRIKWRQCWSSDLSRARETLRILLGEDEGSDRVERREDERLRERYLGTMQGKRRDECTAADAKTIEPTSDFASRLLSFWDHLFPSRGSTLNSIAGPQDPKRILVTSHGGSIRQLLHSLLVDRSYALSDSLGSDLDAILDRRVGNCCITEIEMTFDRQQERWDGIVRKVADEGFFEESSRAPSPGKNEDVVEDEGKP